MPTNLLYMVSGHEWPIAEKFRTQANEFTFMILRFFGTFDFLPLWVLVNEFHACEMSCFLRILTI